MSITHFKSTNFLLLYFFLIFHVGIIQAQDNTDELNKNRFNLDLKKDKFPGMSTDKAYLMMAKKSIKPTEIIVAVIDSGVDYQHEDLKDVMWVNKDEIPDNGIDDDKNGYIDDIHGWNFIGNNQTNVNYDTYEVTREYNRLTKKYAGMSDEQKKADVEYALYQEVSNDLETQINQMKIEMQELLPTVETVEKITSFIKSYIGKDEITLEMLENIKSPDVRVQKGIEIMKEILESGMDENFAKEVREYISQSEKGLDSSFNPRYIVGDDYDNLNDKHYGNNDYLGSTGNHGTHVAGIIAAKRNNKIGINGVASHAKIMTIRAVPNGDERDKDIGNAIMYAVDNGAKIINMSFGKSYSPQYKFVEKAVEYAEDKGVLLVHASGNEAKDTSKFTHNFPNGLIDKKRSKVWLEVGATTYNADSLVASFSNYGKKSVTLFAPGEEIYSCYPNNEYQSNSGTSMAAPMVTGVAALVWSYYPKIPAPQLKRILIESATPYKAKFLKPSEDEKTSKEYVMLTDISIYGGVVNAYKALKLAKKYYKKNKL